MPPQPPRLSLARTPTPLQEVVGLLPGQHLRVKRDDLTGIGLSGNKIRKLEYLLADAQTRGAKRVITCGGIQSNHCRATALAAARLGLQSHLFLRTERPPRPDEPSTGNLRLCRLVGAEITFVSPAQYAQRDRLMRDAASPEVDYVIPEGGSNALGSLGYVRATDELVAQWGSSPPSSLVCAVGSGGTLAGLMMGLKARSLDIPVYGVCVCDDAPTFQGIAARISQEAAARFGLPTLAPDEVRVVDGYVGRGYALSTPTETARIAHVAQRTGLILDPVYTGKAFGALLTTPERFGSAPLFIHTGGIFGLLA